jgi:hypothetical protein
MSYVRVGPHFIRRLVRTSKTQHLIKGLLTPSVHPGGKESERVEREEESLETEGIDIRPK